MLPKSLFHESFLLWRLFHGTFLLKAFFGSFQRAFSKRRFFRELFTKVYSYRCFFEIFPKSFFKLLLREFCKFFGAFKTPQKTFFKNAHRNLIWKSFNFSFPLKFSDDTYLNFPNVCCNLQIISNNAKVFTGLYATDKKITFKFKK